jgi:hypothetical protein
MILLKQQSHLPPEEVLLGYQTRQNAPWQWHLTYSACARRVIYMWWILSNSLTMLILLIVAHNEQTLFDMTPLPFPPPCSMSDQLTWSLGKNVTRKEITKFPRKWSHSQIGAGNMEQWSFKASKSVLAVGIGARQESKGLILDVKTITKTKTCSHALGGLRGQNYAKKKRITAHRAD